MVYTALVCLFVWRVITYHGIIQNTCASSRREGLYHCFHFAVRCGLVHDWMQYLFFFLESWSWEKSEVDVNNHATIKATSDFLVVGKMREANVSMQQM